MQIEHDGTVTVKAPKLMFDFQVRHFIAAHEDWIEKSVQKRRKALSSKSKDEYFFLGQILKFAPGKFVDIKVEDGKLLFPEALLFRKEKEMTNWYIRQAKEIITRQTESYSLKMKTSYKVIAFSDTRSQWGRCTHDNRLQFSWRLVMAPFLVINYVVIHELAHTMEKNHTQMFWMKVRGQNPSYRQQIKWLKENGAGLRV